MLPPERASDVSRMSITMTGVQPRPVCIGARAYTALLAFILMQAAFAPGAQAYAQGNRVGLPVDHTEPEKTNTLIARQAAAIGTRPSSPRPKHGRSDAAVLQSDMHDMQAVTPYVIHDAIVKGPSDLTALTQWKREEHQAPGGGRALLHGRRKPIRYAKCPACTIVRCAGGNGCTGHCRRSRKVRHCSDKHTVMASPDLCSREGNPIVSRLEPPDSLVVTATSPFIGCAHIADRPADAACPAAGTRGVRQPPGNTTAIEYVVEFSVCTRTEYTPDCTNRPYYPLGVCLCSKVSLSGASLGLDACDASELDLPPSVSRSDQEEVRVVIEERGATVHTGIFDYTEPEDIPVDEAEVRILGIETDPDADVTVSLMIYQGRELLDGDAEIGGVDGVVSDDYYDTTEVDPTDEEGPPDYEYAGYEYVDYYPILVEQYPQYYY